MPRFFYGENAGRPIRAGGREYAFEIIGLGGGTQQGVVEVPEAEVAGFLAVAGKWVEEITAEEYAAAIQKKKNGRPLRSTPDSPAPGRLGPPLKGRGAVVVDGSSITRASATAAALPEKVDDVIELGRADAPFEEVQAKVRESKRLNHRQKRGLE